MLHRVLENAKVLTKNQQKFVNAGGVCHKPIVDPCTPEVEEWSNVYCQCVRY
ncbi:hypothetical protein [Aquimarina celericrescens]|uniref:Uncharacterized protein n=1 Tax=Aquimarina celericrescens TaxID=1964542 RepID=A0ABW5B1C0_9FLAO|nr:hypothetical protein [Aquimarina celericrescens]